jgi:oligoribonuclease
MELEKRIVWAWLDLEMTGLCIDKDVILEVALVLTDQALHHIGNSFSSVIYQPEKILSAMNSWCQEHHLKSGLLKFVRESTVSVQQAEQSLCSILDNQPSNTLFILCGNSIWQDRLFINKYMPTFAAKLHYRMIDVSSLKELVKSWYPNNQKALFNKKKNHRAIDDIYESIEELKYYKDYFFIPYHSEVQ